MSKWNSLIIGWREWIALPELGIRHMKAKVDSGARSSSLHAYDLREFEKSGVPYVEFKVHPIQRQAGTTVHAEAPILEYRMVRSSSGKATRRPVILTPIELLGQTWDIEITLANRDEMGFRMLLGREAFRGRFLLDAGSSYYGGKPTILRKKRKNR